MSNRICICGHGEDEHKPMTESDEKEIACFYQNKEEDESTLNYCTCMDFEENVVDSLRNDLKAVEANYDALQSPMPCGHLARYAVNEEDGTQYCVMCLCESLTGTNDTKIQSRIAEIINNE